MKRLVQYERRQGVQNNGQNVGEDSSTIGQSIGAYACQGEALLREETEGSCFYCICCTMSLRHLAGTALQVNHVNLGTHLWAFNTITVLDMHKSMLLGHCLF